MAVIALGVWRYTRVTSKQLSPERNDFGVQIGAIKAFGDAAFEIFFRPNFDVLRVKIVHHRPRFGVKTLQFKHQTGLHLPHLLNDIIFDAEHFFNRVFGFQDDDGVRRFIVLDAQNHHFFHQFVFVFNKLIKRFFRNAEFPRHVVHREGLDSVAEKEFFHPFEKLCLRVRH